MNVLFIDSPVGSGYSYVDDKKHLPTTDVQVAIDLIASLRIFLEENPEFKTVPIHIFGESYGGKISVIFAYLLNREIEQRNIDCNLESVTSISGGISVLDSALSYAPYLWNLGMVDREGFDAITRAAELIKKAFDDGDFVKSAAMWRRTLNVIGDTTLGFSSYYVLLPQVGRKYGSLKNVSVPLNAEGQRNKLLWSLMEEKMNRKLNLPDKVVWHSQHSALYTSIQPDFMRPAIDYGERIFDISLKCSEN